MIKRIVLLLVLLLTLAIARNVTADNSPAADGTPAVGWSVFANGGAPSSAGAIKLNLTLGQGITGSSSSGSAGLIAGYWVACIAAPAVAPTVGVAKSGVDVALNWAANAANAQYQVWVSEHPYFDPAHPGEVTPSITTGTSYTDQGAATSLTNHYYLVRGLNGCGAASGNSNRTGASAFGLTKGTS
jgi:hypothetical protein